MVAVLAGLQALYEETDAITGCWLSHASSLLAACTAQLPQLLRGRWQPPAQHQGQQGLAGKSGGGAVAAGSRAAGAARGSPGRPGDPSQRRGNISSSSVEGPAAPSSTPVAQAGEAPVHPGSGGGSQPEALPDSMTQLVPAAVTAAAGIAAAADPPDAQLPPWALQQQQQQPAAQQQQHGKVEVVHVAVTSGQLTPTLAKLLLFRLSAHFTPDRVSMLCMLCTSVPAASARAGTPR